MPVCLRRNRFSRPAPTAAERKPQDDKSTAAGGNKLAKDIFQSIGSLDAEGVQRIVDRLENRGKDETFVAMRDQYLRQMNIAPDANVLDLGCGTGVVARALATRGNYSGKIVGIDFSNELIDAAQQLATEEGIDDRVEFRVGDASALV